MVAVIFLIICYYNMYERRIFCYNKNKKQTVIFFLILAKPKQLTELKHNNS